MLELKDICKTFNPNTINAKVALNHLNLTLNDGDFVTVIGGNGAGKSTMLNAIAGVFQVDSGTITIDGQDVTKLPEHKRAAFLGRVFQDPSRGTANSMTVAENMALAENKGKPYNLTAGLNKKRVEGYRDMLAPLRLGLEERMNVPVGALSGGQRQVLTLVIATMTPIDLLLLDEHTAALDPKTSEITMLLTDKIISEKKLTALMVTHNLRFAEQYGTRLCMFDKGRVVLDKAGEDKKNTSVDDLLKVFNEISIECGN